MGFHLYTDFFNLAKSVKFVCGVVGSASIILVFFSQVFRYSYLYLYYPYIYYFFFIIGIIRGLSRFCYLLFSFFGEVFGFCVSYPFPSFFFAVICIVSNYLFSYPFLELLGSFYVVIHRSFFYYLMQTLGVLSQIYHRW
jgi:hypothetical protein